MTLTPQLVADEAGPRKHRPELDGLRGLAIVMVMFHHLVLWQHQNATCTLDKVYVYLTEMGWTGVDIFFVLSGFLITGILIDARNDRFYFRNFYARRMLRIFPLYYFVLCLLLLIFPRLSSGPADLTTPPAHQWPFWLYVANFTAIREPFFSAPRILTWSLCIEEQFYLVWPAVVWLFGIRGTLLAGMAALAISIASRAFIAANGWSASIDYYSTITHLDGLAIGSMIATLLRFSPPVRQKLGQTKTILILLFTGVAGAALAVVVTFVRHSSTRQDPIGQIWLFASVSLVGGALLLGALHSHSWIGRIFRSRLLRFFGKYSYGLYLYHLIIQAWILHVGLPSLPTLGRSRMPSQALFLVVNVSVSVIVAMTS